MKRFFVLVPFVALSLLMSCKSGGSGFSGGTAEQPFGEKSGTVVYKPMEMMGVKVTQTLYFDDFGKKTMRETIVEGNMNGVEMKQHTFDITDGFTMYHYETENIENGKDKATKSAYKSTLEPEMFELMNIGSLSDKLKAKVNFKEEGEETVAGMAGSKYSMSPDSTNPDKRITGVHYKNIPLKVSFAEMQIIADKVDFDTKVPAEKFKVPEGYSFMDQTVPSMEQLPEEAPATAEPEKK
jgi:hypothetical protein